MTLSRRADKPSEVKLTLNVRLSPGESGPSMPGTEEESSTILGRGHQTKIKRSMCEAQLRGGAAGRQRRLEGGGAVAPQAVERRAVECAAGERDGLGLRLG